MQSLYFFPQQLAPRQADELHTRRAELQQEESILRDKVATHRERLEEQRRQQEAQRDEIEQNYVVRDSCRGFCVMFHFAPSFHLVVAMSMFC